MVFTGKDDNSIECAVGPLCVAELQSKSSMGHCHPTLSGYVHSPERQPCLLFLRHHPH